MAMFGVSDLAGAILYVAAVLSSPPAVSPDKSCGIVIESVGADSVFARVGAEPNDLIWYWRQEGTSVEGQINSLFDWIWLEIEQGPRGSLELFGARNGHPLRFRLPLGPWNIDVRPVSTEKHCSMLAGLADSTDSGQLWKYLSEGNKHFRSRNLEQALRSYESALQLASSERARAVILKLIGDVHRKKNDLLEAEKAYRSALALQGDQDPESLGAALFLQYLGEVEYEKGDLDAAEAALLKALSIRNTAPSSIEFAASTNALGNVLLHRGDLERAEKAYRDALAIRERMAPDSLELAGSYSNIGLIFYLRDELEVAEEFHQKSLRIRLKIDPDSLGVATSYNNLGLAAFKAGRYAEAEAYYLSGIAIVERVDSNNSIKLALLRNRALVAHARGNLKEAEEAYQTALEIWSNKNPESIDTALATLSLGDIAKDRGNLERARDLMLKALAIFKKQAPNSNYSSSTLQALGALARANRNFQEAEDYYRQALAINEDHGHALGVSSCLNSLGLLAYEQGRLADAKNRLSKALDIQRQHASEGSQVASIIGNLALVFESEGDLLGATKLFLQALEINRRVNPESVDTARNFRDLGANYLAQGEPHLALQAFEEATSLLDNQYKISGGSEEARVDFSERFASVYKIYIETLIKLGHSEQAFHVLERGRARAFRELLGERDLMLEQDLPDDVYGAMRRLTFAYDKVARSLDVLPRDGKETEALLRQRREIIAEREVLLRKARKADPRSINARYPLALDASSTSQALDKGTVLLSYDIRERESTLFIARHALPLVVKKIWIGEEELRREIVLLRNLMSSNIAGNVARKEALERQGKRLYSRLIEPAVDIINMSERMVIVPDGSLNLLPWGALIRTLSSGSAQQYLVAWKSLSVVPSASLSVELRARRRVFPESADTSHSSFSAFSAPILPQTKLLNSQQFQDLPAAKREVEKIAELYAPRAKIYFGAEASEENAKSLTGQSNIIHFATHATLDERFPLNSAVVLSIPEKLEEDKENGLLQGWEIFEQVRIDADLVVLSACESGLGKEMGGEGLIGLTRAFQYAGARSVMASLWKISDRTTAEFMVRFYRHLKEGLSKDEALRATQMEFIRGPIQVTNDKGERIEFDASAPYYWAAFQLYGDWQ